MVKGVLLVSLLAVVSASPNLRERFQDTDGTWEFLGAKGYSGNIVMNELTGSSYFYWLSEKLGSDISQDKAPMIICVPWSPEGSAEVEMLWEPISPISARHGSPDQNGHTWGLDFHLLTIDFPLGVGYSYAAEASDIGNSSMAATEQVYTLLQKLAKKYPSWFDRDLYLYGEHFGGGWALEVAYHILKNNAKTGVINLPLKGLMINSPWIDPPSQLNTFADYCYNFGVMNLDEKGIIEDYQAQVESLLKQEKWPDADTKYTNMHDIFPEYTQTSLSDLTWYGNYYLSGVKKWFRLNSTKELLNVPSSIDWKLFNPVTIDKFGPYRMLSKIQYFPYVLENIKVLVYSTQYDVLVPLTGVQEMLSKVNWTHINDFMKSKKEFWKVENELAGYVQSYDNLTFLLFLETSFFCTYNKPSYARDMIYKFINSEPF